MDSWARGKPEYSYRARDAPEILWFRSAESLAPYQLACRLSFLTARALVERTVCAIGILRGFLFRLVFLEKLVIKIVRLSRLERPFLGSTMRDVSLYLASGDNLIWAKNDL